MSSGSSCRPEPGAGVDPEFDCEWRKYAFKYAARIMLRLAADTNKMKQLFDALELHSLCKEEYVCMHPTVLYVPRCNAGTRHLFQQLGARPHRVTHRSRCTSTRLQDMTGRRARRLILSGRCGRHWRRLGHAAQRAARHASCWQPVTRGSMLRIMIVAIQHQQRTKVSD